MQQYDSLLEEQIFMSGESQGRIKASITVLTDMLLELNSLEIFYQKPVSKSVAPQEIASLREKVDLVKQFLREAIAAPSRT